MKELIRANDPVLLSWVVATLSGQNIEAVIFDTHTSVLEGSVTAIERRVMVIDEDFVRAKRILDDARDDGFHV